MIDENDPLFSRGGTNETRSSGRKLLLLLLLFLIAAVGGFLLFLGEIEDKEPPPTVEVPDPPIVSSEEIKSPPDEPGGLEIAHQDKLIYERLTPASATVSSEDSLDEVVMGLVAEEPLADFSAANSSKDSTKPAAPSASAEDSPEPTILSDSVEDSVEPTDTSIETETSEMETNGLEEKAELTILPDFVKDSVRLAVTSNEPETKETEASESKGEAEPEPELSVTPSLELNGSGDYVVQLAAFSINADANAALEQTALKFSDAVGGNMLLVQRVDLGDRGIWYRLRVGYFATPDEAEEVCAEFQSLGQDCLVTTR